MQNILVIFDYDWSLINTNSDEYIFDEILPQKGYVLSYAREHYDEGWTAAVNAGLRQVHEHLDGSKETSSCSLSKIKQVAASVPIQDRMLDAVKHAANAKCDLYIVSDANTIFIQEMLKHHNIYPLFENKIFTNYAEVLDNGLLQVKPFHSAPHGCPYCPDNLCKGLVVEDIFKKKDYDRIIYIGDGGGDFCPILRLKRPTDIVLARQDPDKNYGLLKRISKHKKPDEIQATVKTWSTGHDIYNAFQEYIPLEIG